MDASHPAAVEEGALESVKGQVDRLLSIQGTRTVDGFHKGWATSCGSTAAWSAAKRASNTPLDGSASCATSSWRDVKVTGVNEDFNQTLERAGRVAGFLEMGELMCIDALHRRRSCGGHFRASRRPRTARPCARDDEFLYVAAWGVHRRRAGTRPAQGTARLRVHRTEAEELQVNITLRVWRQQNAQAEGRMVTYQVQDVSEDMSFLEMLDLLNERLTVEGEDPSHSTTTAVRASVAPAVS